MGCRKDSAAIGQGKGAGGSLLKCRGTKSSTDEWRCMLYHTPVASRSVFSSAVMLTSTPRRCSSALLQTRGSDGQTDQLSDNINSCHSSSHRKVQAAINSQRLQLAVLALCISEHMLTSAPSVPLLTGWPPDLPARPPSRPPAAAPAGGCSPGRPRRLGGASAGQTAEQVQSTLDEAERDTGRCHRLHGPACQHLITAAQHGMPQLPASTAPLTHLLANPACRAALRIQAAACKAVSGAHNAGLKAALGLQHHL